MLQILGTIANFLTFSIMKTLCIMVQHWHNNAIQNSEHFHIYIEYIYHFPADSV
jgi:hypothetical protein